MHLLIVFSFSQGILPCAVPSSHATPVSSKRETSNWTQQQTTGAIVAAALESPMPSLPFTASAQDPSSQQRQEPIP
jgi:hypothetical protein